MAWGLGNVGGGNASADKSIIIVTAPDDTTSVTATYNGKVKSGTLKDGLWYIKGLDFGADVIWTVKVLHGSQTITRNQAMPRLDIVYLNTVELNIFADGNQFTNITGGFVNGATSTGGWEPSKIVFSKNIASLISPPNKYSCGYLTTKNALDLKGYNYIEVKVTEYNSNNRVGYIAITDSNHVTWDTGNSAQNAIPSLANVKFYETGTIRLKIPEDYDKPLYVGVATAQEGSGEARLSVSSIKAV